MIIKKLILMTACLLSLSAWADGTYLHIRTASGWEVVNLEKADKMTFKNNVVQITAADNSVLASYPQNALETMYIDEIAGVGDVKDDNTEAAFIFDSASRSVRMTQDSDLKVYDLKGKLLVGIPEVKEGETVNLSALAPSIIILKSGNYTVKTQLK